jgi:maleylpyruvate isomerase
VNAEQQALQEQIDQATEWLLATVSGFTDSDVRQPSLLPGWTRAHVLTHLARGADALRNLLVWARTGVETPAYASQEARNAAIEEGARRGADDLLTDVSAAAMAYRSEVLALSGEAWQVEVHALNIPPFPVSDVPIRRLVEVELHHTDLGAGYRPVDWPAEFAAMDLPGPMRSQREDRIRAAGG